MPHQGLKRVGKLVKTDQYKKGYIHQYYHDRCYGVEKLSNLKLLNGRSPEEEIQLQVHDRKDLRISLDGLHRQLARDKQYQAFKIFPNKTLDALVSEMPTDNDTLLAIHGIGPNRFDDYLGNH